MGVEARDRVLPHITVVWHSQGVGGFAQTAVWRAGCVAIAVALAAVPLRARAHAGVDELVREASAVAADHPRDPEAHLQYARALRLAGRPDAALAELDTAARRGADVDEVDAARGAVLLDARRPQQALRAFDRVLAHQPAAHAVRFERGRAQLALGDREQAARDFGVALAALRDPQPEQVIARRDALLGLGRPDEALRALDEGMARLGRVAALQLAAVDIELTLGRFEAAVGRLDTLLAGHGLNPAWLARRAEILARAGRADEARRGYAQALALIDVPGSTRRTHAFDDLRNQIAAALTAPPLGGIPCAPRSATSSP